MKLKINITQFMQQKKISLKNEECPKDLGDLNKRSGCPRLKGDRRWLEKMFEELFTENYSTFCKDKPTDSRHGENLKQDQPREMCANTHHSQMSENNRHSLRSREREAPSYLRGWVTLEKATLKSEISARMSRDQKKRAQ